MKYDSYKSMFDTSESKNPFAPMFSEPSPSSASTSDTDEDKANKRVIRFITAFYQLNGEYPATVEVPAHVFEQLTNKTIYVTTESRLLDPVGDLKELFSARDMDHFTSESKRGQASYSYVTPLAITILEAKSKTKAA